MEGMAVIQDLGINAAQFAGSEMSKINPAELVPSVLQTSSGRQ